MQPLKVTVVPVTPFQQNCSIVACTATNRAAIVDPGGDVARIREAIDQLKVDAGEDPADARPSSITRAARPSWREALSLPIEGPDERDAFLLANLEAQGARFGITDVRNVKPTRWLVEGETVSVGDLTFNVLHVPGSHARPPGVRECAVRASRWSATRCFRARSAAPIFPMATTSS